MSFLNHTKSYLKLIHILTWEIVNMLQVFGFTISYSSIVGAQATINFNRFFLGDFKSEKITTMKKPNIIILSKNLHLLIYYVFSHVMKKIEYNILRILYQAMEKGNSMWAVTLSYGVTLTMRIWDVIYIVELLAMSYFECCRLFPSFVYKIIREDYLQNNFNPNLKS